MPASKSNKNWVVEKCLHFSIPMNEFASSSLQNQLNLNKNFITSYRHDILNLLLLLAATLVYAISNVGIRGFKCWYLRFQMLVSAVSNIGSAVSNVGIRGFKCRYLRFQMLVSAVSILCRFNIL